MLAKFLVIFIALIQISQETPVKATQPQYNVNSFLSSRIVGGVYAPDGDSKHMVALVMGYYIRSLMCGGSIISDRLILTAAHCIEPVVQWGVLSPSFIGVVGSNYWNSTNTELTFSGYLNHPEWNRDTIKNDIGVLFTVDRIKFDDLVSPIALSYDRIGGGHHCFVTGWGRLGTWLNIPYRLQLLYVDTITSKECSQGIEEKATLWGWAPPLDSKIEICTFHSIGHGMCNGDSGSALVSKKSGKQIGIVSWGFPCAIGGPDVYVRISGFRNFLLAIIKKYHV